METTIQTTKKTFPIKEYFAAPSVKAKFEEMLGKRAPQFITSVLQIASSNAILKDADPASIYNAAATAATLDLPLNNNLGWAYIVPYGKQAQFQMGYKGFIQLAQRSGKFKSISVCPAYDGDTDEDIRARLFGIVPVKPKSDIIAGYVSGFVLINGFEKTLYMTIETIKKHGQKYSQTFKRGSGLWATDFESMATKTVLKQLLSKFAPLSIDMQTAVQADQAIIKQDPETEETSFEYVDNQEPDKEEKSIERYRLLIEDCATVAELKQLEKDCPIELLDLFTFKMENSNGK
jgi:recombination protein RecT